MKKTKDDVVQSHCNACLRQNKHNVIARREREFVERDEDGVPYFSENLVYELVECCGCEEVSLRRTYSSDAQPNPSVTCFPPAASRRKPSWMTGLSLLAMGGPK